MPHVPQTVKSIIDSNSAPNIPLALYLHIPYCQTRCTYCAFNTFTGRRRQVTQYVAHLCREIELVAGDARLPAHTVYFGGGTPSLLPPDAIRDVLATVRRCFALAPDTEITLEANPGDVDLPYLQALRAEGITRLSIGMQSTHDSELHLFARRHTFADVTEAVSVARAAEIQNLSLDLIYGIPHQTLAMWQASLRNALSLEPEHLSMYSLGIEEGTPLERWIEQGRVPEPDPDLAADMYEWATDALAAAGFAQYEISNWARPGFECAHNLHYWHNQPYLGFGPGAHGYANDLRYNTVLDPAGYMERIQTTGVPLPFPLSPAVDSIDPIDEEAAMAETMIMGLRLTQQGVSEAAFLERHGRALWEVYGPELSRVIEWGLVEQTGHGAVRLTRRGRLLGNRVFREFL